MKLSNQERLAFIYQLRILEALYPDEAAYYEKHRTALELGFTLQYEWMFDNLHDEMSEDDCREVLDILDMYRAIKYFLKTTSHDDPLRNHHLVEFSGFDGNHEPQQMSYARYFIVDLNRYQELRKGEFQSFNSHCPMLQTYRKMLVKWKNIEDRFNLSRAQVVEIIGADL